MKNNDMNKMITNFYGYIDPGSGSAIAAIIISAIVGLGMTFKLYWVKLKDKVSKNPSYNRPAKPDVISPYIKGFSDSITEEEGEFGTGS